MIQSGDSTIPGRIGLNAEKAQFGFLLLMFLSGFFSIAISQIALGLALILALYRWFGEGNRPAKTRMEIPALLLAAWALLMIPLSSDSQISLIYYRRFFLLTAIWVVASCANNERRRRLFLCFLVCGALCISLYGQFSLLVAGQSLFSVRMTGPFNSMTTGGVLMLAAILVFGFLLSAKVGWRWKLVLAMAALSLTIGVAQTSTRSAILGLVCGLVFMLLITRPKLLGSLLLATVGMVLVFQGQLLELIPDRLESRFYPSAIISGKSPQDRLEMLHGGLAMVRANPLFGVGDRGIMEIAPEYYGDQNTRYYGHLHSNPIQMAVIWGLPGFILGSLFLLAPGWILLKRWWALRSARKEGRAPPFLTGWVLGALGAWLGFNFAGLTEWYFGDAECMLIYLGLLGCALGSTMDSEFLLPSNSSNGMEKHCA